MSKQFQTAIRRLRRQAVAKRAKVKEYESRGLKSHATRARHDAEAFEAKADRLEARHGG